MHYAFDVFLRFNVYMSLEIRPSNVLFHAHLHTGLLGHQCVNLAALKFSEMRNFRAARIN